MSDSLTRHLALARDGLGGTSLAAIAGDAGVTKQALLHHFGSEELLQA
ncbi:TetR family transcriptional regulator [Roseobacter sp. HKCCA0434]|nr:TetR family transcriptional regulator [Roseobacter sp. HKCCA0434]